MLERRKEGGVVGVTSRWGFESILVLVTPSLESTPPLYTQDHLLPCYWINVVIIYVSTPQYNYIKVAFFTINHFSFHTKSKTHTKIYWTFSTIPQIQNSTEILMQCILIQ